MKPEFWCKWNIFSRSDIETSYYLSKFENKAEAYGVFLWLVELCYQSSTGELEVDEIFLESTAAQMGIAADRLPAFMETLVKAKLSKSKQNCWSSNRAMKDRMRRDETSKLRAEAGRKGGTISGASKHLLSKSKQIKAKTLDKNRLDLNNSTTDVALPVSKKPDRKDPDLEKITFPKSLNDPHSREALNIWLAHKKAKNQKYKTEKSIDLLLKHWSAAGSAQFIEAVHHSIRNNYSGIFAPSQNSKQSPSPVAPQLAASRPPPRVEALTDEDRRRRLEEGREAMQKAGFTK